MTDMDSVMNYISDCIKEGCKDDQEWLGILQTIYATTRWESLEKLLCREAAKRGCCQVCLVEGRGLVPESDTALCPTCEEAFRAFNQEADKSNKAKAG